MSMLGAKSENPLSAIPWLTDAKALDNANVRQNQEQGLSLRQIGHALTERGMYPRSGRAWHPESVSNLLKAWNEWPVEARA